MTRVTGREPDLAPRLVGALGQRWRTDNATRTAPFGATDILGISERA
jgi:hypothetical protein